MNYIILLLAVYVGAHILGYVISAAIEPFDLSCLDGDETEYLLGTQANADHLMSSINQLRANRENQ